MHSLHHSTHAPDASQLVQFLQMDLDLQQFVTQRAMLDASIEQSDATILELQDRIKEGLELARNAAAATAEQFALKKAALDCKDEQIAALTAQLAQLERGVSLKGVHVHQFPHTAGMSGKKRSRQRIAIFITRFSNCISIAKLVRIGLVCAPISCSTDSCRFHVL
jgi:hypothetical protein